MKFLICLLGVFTIVTACGPRDVPVNGDNKNGTSGNGLSPQTIVVLEDEGERSTTCPAKFEDSVNINSPEDRDDLILDGTVTAALSAGDRNCFRIGSVVNLRNSSKTNPDAPIRAKLRVVKTEVIPVEKLVKSHAKAMGMTLVELKEFANAQLESAKKVFNPKGWANLTYFEVVDDSTDDNSVEPTPVKPVVPPVNTPVVVAPSVFPLIFDQLSERPTTCPEKFTDAAAINSPESLDSLIFSGQKQAAFSAGDRNCFRIGSIVNLQNKTKLNPQAPVRGRLKILKVEILKVDTLNLSHAQVMGLGLDELKAYVASELEAASKVFNPQGIGSVIYFEYIKDSNPQAPPEKSPEDFDPSI